MVQSVDRHPRWQILTKRNFWQKIRLWQNCHPYVTKNISIETQNSESTDRSTIVQLVEIQKYTKNNGWESIYFDMVNLSLFCDIENFAHTAKKKSLYFWSRRCGNDFLWHPWSTCKFFWKKMKLKSFLQRGFRIYKEGPKKKKYWKKLDRWKVRCVGAKVQYLDSLTRLGCCRVRLSLLYYELSRRFTYDASECIPYFCTGALGTHIRVHRSLLNFFEVPP